MNIDCPECKTKLAIGDGLLGKNVRCPRCSKVFAASRKEEPVEPILVSLSPQVMANVPEPVAPSSRREPDIEIIKVPPLDYSFKFAEEDLEELEEVVEKPRDVPRGDVPFSIALSDSATGDPAGWRKARAGLFCIVVAVLALAVGILLLLAVMNAQDNGLAATTILMMLFVLAVLGAVVTYIVGSVLLLATPNQDARGRAVLHLVFLLLYVLLIVGQVIWTQTRNPPRDEFAALLRVSLDMSITIVAQVCGVITGVFILFYLRQISQAFARFGLARQCNLYLMVILAVGLLSLIAIASLESPDARRAAFAGMSDGGLQITIVGVGVFFLALFLWYLIIVLSVASAIGDNCSYKRRGAGGIEG